MTKKRRKRRRRSRREEKLILKLKEHGAKNPWALARYIIKKYPRG